MTAARCGTAAAASANKGKVDSSYESLAATSSITERCVLVGAEIDDLERFAEKEKVCDRRWLELDAIRPPVLSPRGVPSTNGPARSFQRGFRSHSEERPRSRLSESPGQSSGRQSKEELAELRPVLSKFHTQAPAHDLHAHPIPVWTGILPVGLADHLGRHWAVLPDDQLLDLGKMRKTARLIQRLHSEDAHAIDPHRIAGSHVRQCRQIPRLSCGRQRIRFAGRCGYLWDGSLVRFGAQKEDATGYRPRKRVGALLGQFRKVTMVGTKAQGFETMLPKGRWYLPRCGHKSRIFAPALRHLLLKNGTPTAQSRKIYVPRCCPACGVTAGI